jgi:hypothetical protein
MAFSLVKDDPGRAATVALWREVRAWRDERHPDAVLVPEGGAQGHIGRARGDDAATPCLSDVR